MMNERKHKWTWDDFRPPRRERPEIELDLLSCIFNCPSSINLIEQSAIEIQFKKSLHQEIFVKISQLTKQNKSMDSTGIMRAFLDEVRGDSPRQMIDNIFALVSAHSQLPTPERVLELAAELAEFN